MRSAYTLDVAGITQAPSNSRFSAPMADPPYPRAAHHAPSKSWGEVPILDSGVVGLPSE